MIVVKVELHPASGGPAKEIGRMHIYNDGSGTESLGNYRGISFRGRTTAALNNRTVSRRGSVLKYPRLKLHVWHLVSNMLKAMGYHNAEG